MEAETPPLVAATNQKEFVEPLPISPDKKIKLLSSDACDEDDPNSTIHAFNISNVTVIERLSLENQEKSKNLSPESDGKQTTGDGSDSGVETCGANDGILQRAFSSNSGGYASSCGIEDCTPAQSCDSSLISCCSTYEDAYDLLARKNSTLLEDLKMNRGDGTSEGGSESSSVTGSTSSRPTKRIVNGIKKKVAVSEPSKAAKLTPPNNIPNNKNRTNATPRTTPAKVPQDRSKSKERKPTTPRPSTLKTTSTPRPKPAQEKPIVTPDKKETNKSRPPRSTSSTRVTKTPVVTPTDDGRWPSSTNRNNLMTRSFRGSSVTSDVTSIKSRVTQLQADKSTIEKYATLPRRRRERSADNIRDSQKPPSREPSINRASNLRKQTSRENTPGRSLPPFPKKKQPSKTRIYHEVSAQTCLTIEDVEKALAGVGIKPVNPYDVETESKEIQCDRRHEKVEQLEAQLKTMQEKNNKLISEQKDYKEKISDMEQKLAMEKVEKQALKEELERNMSRVQTILGNTEDNNHQGNLF